MTLPQTIFDDGRVKLVLQIGELTMPVTANAVTGEKFGEQHGYKYVVTMKVNDKEYAHHTFFVEKIITW